MNVDFRLVHETAQGAGAAFRLREGTQLVGRGNRCEIQLMDKSVSREHAALPSTTDASRSRISAVGTGRTLTIIKSVRGR